MTVSGPEAEWLAISVDMSLVCHVWQFEKEQADSLLRNILPEHVADVLKRHEGYSQTYENVGVIFAKISNFDDFYDEAYEGGREFLRVLNELMGDFEELFDTPKYKDVEKIKTIGSCLMASAGLNKEKRDQNSDPKAHLYALMDFSMDLLKKLAQFNRDMLSFQFEMEIGYNFGEVTAGVVGTTKLLYDIWGDAVNVASRMYSTGVHGKIQVCSLLLVVLYLLDLTLLVRWLEGYVNL